MTSRTRTSSPRFLARMIAVFSLLTIVAGIFAQAFVSERLVDFSNAATTATNILSNRSLFRLGFTVYLIEMACQLTAAVLFYQLLKSVNQTVALLALLLEVTGLAVKICARVFFIAPLVVLRNPAALQGFSVDQLQSVALIFLKVNDQGAGVAVAFFGFSTLLGGYLILRSTFLPRWLGIVSIFAGSGWLTYFYRPLGDMAFPIVVLLGLAGSAATIFWLLVFGVNEEKWIKQTDSVSRHFNM